MSIASNLRREMDEQGVTADALARAVDVEPSSVRKYLSGKIRPSDGVLARLARCLNCTPQDIKYGRPKRRDGKLTTAEVSRATGIDELSIRVGCQRGFWPFGVAYKRPGSTQYTYEYDPAAVIRWVAERDAVRGGGEYEKGKPVPGSLG